MQDPFAGRYALEPEAAVVCGVDNLVRAIEAHLGVLDVLLSGRIVDSALNRTGRGLGEQRRG